MGNYVIVKEGNNYMVKLNGWIIMYCGDSYAECVQYICDVFMK